MEENQKMGRKWSGNWSGNDFGIDQTYTPFHILSMQNPVLLERMGWVTLFKNNNKKEYLGTLALKYCISSLPSNSRLSSSSSGAIALGAYKHSKICEDENGI